LRLRDVCIDFAEYAIEGTIVELSNVCIKGNDFNTVFSKAEWDYSFQEDNA
jgi:hypothetical protein